MAMNTRQIAVLVSLTALSVVFAAAALAKDGKDQPVNTDDYKPGTLMADNTIVIAAEKINNGHNLSVIFAMRKDAATIPGGVALIMDFREAMEYCASVKAGGHTNWQVPKDQYEIQGLKAISEGPLKDGFLMVGYDPTYEAHEPWSDRYWTQDAEHVRGVLHRGVWQLSTGNLTVDNGHIDMAGGILGGDNGNRYVARTRCVAEKTFTIQQPAKKR